jgi:hypothetical protein
MGRGDCTEFIAGATRMSFGFMSMVASVSQARMTEVRRLSDMPLTTWGRWVSIKVGSCCGP